MRNVLKILAAPVVFGGVYIGCEEAESAPFYQERSVEVRDIIVRASAAGVIEPVLTVDVKSKASGEIMELRVETGDNIQRGQLIALIDRRNPKNTLAQAEADLNVAEAQLQNADAQLRRSETLFRSQSITEQELDNARLQHANANAAKVRAEVTLQNAKNAMQDTRVLSPITGTIIQKSVERGQVISSPTRDVGGGTILLQMANLDTVQVRALVDETDIGKISPGLVATIIVDAFPNQLFEGRVLKIEPRAEIQQNVTMFPVLVRIDNSASLLRPGMSTEVEVHIGQAEGVLAVPSSALRTMADVSSAAMVLGLDPDEVRTQIEDMRQARRMEASARFGGSAQQPEEQGDARVADRRTMEFGGRQVPLPEGITEEQVRGIIQKMRSGGGPQSLSAADRRILGRLRGGTGEAGRRSGRQQTNAAFQFGGEYVVFTLRDGQPTPMLIRTGLTDLDYAEVREGLEEGDIVLILPSLGLLQEQENFANRFRSLGQLPGMGGNNNRRGSSQSRGR